MHLMSLYRLIERAFGTAALGYQLHQAEELKIEGQNFAKTAEKFGRMLGEGVPELWKKFYEHFACQILDQVDQEMTEWLSIL